MKGLLIVLITLSINFFAICEESKPPVGYTYYDEDNDIKIKFNTNLTFECFKDKNLIKQGTYTLGDKSQEEIPIILTSGNNENFLSLNEEYEWIIGKITSDSYCGFVKVERLAEKLTLNSVEVGGITVNSTPKDLVLLYPKARVISRTDWTREYLVDGLEDFSYVNFKFNDNNKLIYILKLNAVRGADVISNLEKAVRDLTKKYGVPVLKESVFSYMNENKRVNETDRKYSWKNHPCEILIEHTRISDEYGHVSYESVSVEYYFDEE